MFFLHQLRISLVYWVNLFKTHCLGGHTRLQIWYNPCIIRQYMNSKTAENHVLFYICLILPFAEYQRRIYHNQCLHRYGKTRRALVLHLVKHSLLLTLLKEPNTWLLFHLKEALLDFWFKGLTCLKYRLAKADKSLEWAYSILELWIWHVLQPIYNTCSCID